MLAQRQVDGFITIFGLDYAVAQTLQLQSHEVTRVIAVLDEQGRLLGAVTVDDVLDRLLGAGWRIRHEEEQVG